MSRREPALGSGALQGITVLDCSRYITGPYATMLLADLGAQVIKVEEKPLGDPYHSWGENNYSIDFCAVNSSK